MSTVESTFTMFARAELFNQDISGWDMSSVTSMTGMFQGALSFNQDLSGWNVSEVTSMSGMFSDTSFSNENYDKVLISWSKLPLLQNGVRLGAPDNQYCEAGEERQTIIDTYNWIIDDGGQVFECQQNPQPFITTWKTDNPGISGNDQIIVPTLIGETYDYTIDWGDGTSEIVTTSESPVHSYAQPGIYEVSISGRFPRIFFNGFTDENGPNSDAQKLLEIKQWGTIQWSSMDRAFRDCTNLDVVALDSPDLSNVLTTNAMFAECSSLTGNESFENWKTGNLIQLDQMFLNAVNFNQNLGSWDLSNARNLFLMFGGCSSFNQPIGDWNVSNVTNMSNIFARAKTFDQDIGG